ncbi:unnamed protein product [Allacma fusca]|uniref:Uncharacterized protein n=1 Tax=Allacma fusca TaxID=39272 RepID=A0A8J2JWT3_9HEXA|nr:unnamed protein product [Allacma fusca]
MSYRAFPLRDEKSSPIKSAGFQESVSLQKDKVHPMPITSSSEEKRDTESLVFPTLLSFRTNNYIYGSSSVIFLSTDISWVTQFVYKAMDEDFGFVERRPGTTLISPSKIEHGKLTNGNNSTINLHPDDDCRDATSGEVSDQLDQSLRKLSVSLSESSDRTSGDVGTSEENNNNNDSVEPSKTGNNMLKHIKTVSKSGKVPGTPSNVSKGDSDSSITNSSQKDRDKSSQGSPTRGGTDKITKNSVAPSSEPENQITLPQRFVVKYLGYRETSNLWGIKYTRRPVDEMVTEAKTMLAKYTDKSLPLLKLEVTESGIVIGPMPQNNNPIFPSGKFAIEAISYGVQDLAYTRVFAMIVVKSALTSDDEQSQSIRLAEIQKAANGGSNGESLPFRCHAFVCDSRQTARKLTYSLAAAFHKFSQSVAAGKIAVQKPKKFAIDLRSPEDIEADLDETEA